MALALSIGTPLGSPGGATLNSFTNFLDFYTIRIQDSVELGSDSMDFTLYIYNKVISPPEEGNEVFFQDLGQGTTEFAGVVTSISRSFGRERNEIKYECECKDYTYLLNRRYVNNVYSLNTINTLLGTSLTVITAGALFKAILTDLFNDSNNDIHYEYFKDNVSQIEDGPELREMTFDKIIPSQVFDSISNASGMIWNLGFDKEISLKLIETEPASQLPSITLDINNDLVNFFDFKEQGTVDDSGTELLLRDVRRESTGFHVDEFKGSEGQSHNGNDNKIFYLSRKPLDTVSISTVEKDTGGGFVEQDKNVEDVAGELTGGEGTSTDVFMFITSIDGGSYIRFSDANTVADTDDIKVTYKYTILDDSERVNIKCRDEMIRRTGGDGIHQFLYTQTSGMIVRDIDDLNQLEDIILERKCKVLKRGRFSSWTKGWKSGQWFIRLWTGVLIPEVMFVITVDKQVLTPADDPNINDNVIVSHITYSNIPHGVAF